MALIEERLKTLIENIAAKEEYKNPEIIINEISSGGANYTSKLFTAVVKESNKDDLHLFAKVATFGEKLREEVPWDLFERERFVYTELFKAYQSIEKENGVPDENRLSFTKVYGFDHTLYNETVILENLSAQGFGPYDRFHSFDWEYASSAITELAKLHALSFAYKEKFPEKFDEFEEKTKTVWKEGFVDAMTAGAVTTALKTVKPEYRDTLENHVNKYMKDILDTFCAPVHHTAIIHGDYRGSNLLHREREKEGVDIKMVDFQTMRGGSPVCDLFYFIFTGSDEQFRTQYYDKLVEHYYTQLSAAMTRLRLDPDYTYSKQDFYEELKEKLPYALCIVTYLLPVITVETEEAPKLEESLDLNFLSEVKPSDLYAERLNGIVNDFVKWGILK